MNEIYATFTTRKLALTEALARMANVLVAENHIVRTLNGVCLKFTISANGAVTNPLHTSSHKATRFSLRNATAVAATVTDGTGKGAIAVSAYQAISDELAQVNNVLALIAARQAEAPNKPISL